MEEVWLTSVKESYQTHREDNMKQLEGSYPKVNIRISTEITFSETQLLHSFNFSLKSTYFSCITLNGVEK